MLGLVVPPWLNIKLIGAWFIGLAFLGLLWSWNSRGHEIQRYADFQSGVIQATSLATVEPDAKGHIALLKPEQIVTAITGLKSSYVSAKTTLKAINTRTVAAKRTSDAEDAKLAAQIANFNKQYAVANARIKQLEGRKPVSAADRCSVIADDTNSAWDGWK